MGPRVRCVAVDTKTDSPPPPRVTFRRVVAPLRGPGQSPVLPFACCVGSLRSVGRCGRCSCWCRCVAPPQGLAPHTQHVPQPPGCHKGCALWAHGFCGAGATGAGNGRPCLSGGLTPMTHAHRTSRARADVLMDRPLEVGVLRSQAFLGIRPSLSGSPPPPPKVTHATCRTPCGVRTTLRSAAMPGSDGALRFHTPNRTVVPSAVLLCHWASGSWDAAVLHSVRVPKVPHTPSLSSPSGGPSPRHRSANSSPPPLFF